MLSLTHVFLHNWHRFTNSLIPVEDSLYLAGHNGSGKSTILDAIQVVLIGERTRMRFNSSAQERSLRNLDTYVRGKIGEHWVRPGNTVSYIALEFTNTTDRLHQTTLGICIESGEGTSTERTFFIIDGELDPATFVTEQQGKKRGLTRKELKQLFRKKRKARTFDQVGEYQVEMRNALGGLNERFFDLFLRALTFQPMRNIREFVERWLLEQKDLDVGIFQQIVDRLQQLNKEAQVVAQKLEHLKNIVAQQQEYHRLQQQYDEYSVLIALLKQAQAEREWTAIEQNIDTKQQTILKTEEEYAIVQAAFEGTQEALIAAQVKLEQSDIVRHRRELQKQIQEATREADAIVQQRTKLWQDMKRESEPLRPLVNSDKTKIPSLSDIERANIQTLLQTIDTLHRDQPPPDHLVATLDTAIATLDTSSDRLQKPMYDYERQRSELEEKQKELEKRLARLKKGQRPYLPEVERVRDVLEPVVGKRPVLLCEVLEIPDERWQNAVEAMLGRRRFHIIVPPKWFESALHELDRLRSSEQVYGVGLIDLKRAHEGQQYAQPNSLATQVTTSSADLHDVLRSYINTVLGNIICCESIVELRKHRRAITADVVLYSEWTAQAVHPKMYDPRFVGKRAIQSQIESCQHELEQTQKQMIEVQKRVQDIHVLFQILNRGRAFSNLRQQCENPLDDQLLRTHIAAWQADLQALDLSGVAELEREVTRLKELFAKEKDQMQNLSKTLGGQQSALKALQEQQRHIGHMRDECNQSFEEICTQLPHAVSGGQTLFAEKSTNTKLKHVITSTENKRNDFNSQKIEVQKYLTERATTYNTHYQFAAIAGDPNEQKYAEEYRRLDETDLPRYQKQIEQAQQESEEELREHVLHRLREYIRDAKSELDQINDALKRIEFHNERYRFRYASAEDVHEYYDLITESLSLGSGSLYESEFYQKNKATFDRFYQTLTTQPKSDAEAKEQQRLTDYRCYLDYDIEVTHADGSTSRLSKIMGHTSGGETQTPFYVTIAASFAQLYHINDRHSRPTIRLVAFDEAFSKMDQNRIGATLNLLQHFGLQIITATPLERCEYLVPHMCTNLVLSVVQNMVLIEPYRNYAARLQTE